MRPSLLAQIALSQQTKTKKAHNKHNNRIWKLYKGFFSFFFKRKEWLSLKGRLNWFWQRRRKVLVFCSPWRENKTLPSKYILGKKNWKEKLLSKTQSIYFEKIHLKKEKWMRQVIYWFKFELTTKINFYKKLLVVSFYWFKFKSTTEITFFFFLRKKKYYVHNIFIILSQQILSGILLLVVMDSKKVILVVYSN